MNLETLKLGKRAPRIDPRTLRLAKYVKALPPPPKTMGYIDAVHDWKLFLNDSLGDCTCAAAGHQIMQWTTYATKEVIPTDAAILQAYEAVSGYNPNDPSTDQGAVILDVLNYWRKHGIAGHKIAAFAQINPSNFVEIQQAVALFGSVYLGVGLPVSAQDPRTDQNGLPIWEVPTDGPIMDGSPGSWGGHAIPAVGYKASAIKNGGLRVVSWGQLFDMSWNFLAAYCDEAWAIVTPDWIEQNGKSPSGFDLATLLSDLSAVTAAKETW